MNRKSNIKVNFYVSIGIDIIMMVLLVLNLSLIIFDALFTVEFVNRSLETYTPDFYEFYLQNIHLNFGSIDVIFVSAFLAEFMLSWILAIVQKTYYKWFFYPFLHWYDLVGCIPVGSLRFLRVLRVFSILIRLQNLKIIDLTRTYVFRKVKKYYGIVVEEVSDRVVVNILEGVQEEIVEGGPVIDKILNDVIRPRQDDLVEWISRRLEYALQRDVIIKKDELDLYVQGVISKSIAENRELGTLAQIPVMGKMITETIENAITNIVNNVLDNIITDLASYKNRELIKDTTEVVLNSIEFEDEDSNLNKIFKDISVDALEVVKKQVKVQKWKLKEVATKDASPAEKQNIEMLLSEKD